MSNGNGRTTEQEAGLLAPHAQSTLAKFDPQNFWPKDFEEGIKYATFLAKAPSLLPKHIRESKDPAAEILAHIMYGYEVGLAPLQSLRAIYIVHGRAGLYAADQIAIIIKHPSCEFLRVKMKVLPDGTKVPMSDAKSCTWETKAKGQDAQELTFTMAEAEAEGLVAGNAKYKSAPAVMLRWRCATRLLAYTWGHVLRGLEVREDVEAEEKDGGWVERTATKAPPPPPSRPPPAVEAAELVVDEDAAERARAVESLRRAHELSQAAQAVRDAPAAGPPTGDTFGIDFSAPDATEQLLAKMRSVAGDPAGTPQQLSALEQLGARCPPARRSEVDKLYIQARRHMSARKP